MTERVYVAEITAYDPDGATEVTRYYATHGFATAAGDTPADTYVAPRIKQPASIRREIFDRDDLVGGRTKVTLGDLVLQNNDGQLDDLEDLVFAGRPVVIRVGSIGAAYPSAWTTVFVGTMDGSEPRRREIVIRLRDRALELDVPLQENRYAGTSTPTAGFEGTADDLKGQVKPWGRGKLFEVPVAYVNTVLKAFQAHDGAVQSWDAIYLGGNADLSAGTAHASAAALEGATVTAGQYDTWSAGGVFRLETAPLKTVTADVTIGATSGDRTAAQIAEYLVGTIGPIASGDITAADITALDSANSAEIGYWTADDGATIAQALDEVCRSVGAYWYFDRDGKFRVARLEAPSGTPTITLRLPGLGVSMGSGDAKIIDYEFLPVEVPAWRVTVGYRRIELTQDGGLAGAALDDEARVAYLAAQYRTVNAFDGAVKTAYLDQARDLRIDTRMAGASPAGTEASRLLALLKVKRQRMSVQVAIEDTQVEGVDLGKVVSVQMDRYGLGSGKLFLVIGQELDLRRNRADLTLWG